MQLMPGLNGSAERIVSEQDSAIAQGSGSLLVFATPRLAALLEEAACNAIAAVLAPGQTSVGVRIEIDHLAPTPLGRRVRATAILNSIEGRTLNFSVSAQEVHESGPGEIIGQGIHRRVLVDAARFMQKAEGKR